MANEERLIMTAQEAIAKAEQELSTSRYIAECTRSPGMRSIHSKRCTWLSVIVALAKKAVNVDAVEVVHGRWIELHLGKLRCSVCEGECMCEGWLIHGKYDYCPHCGAKMDGGNEDGNL